MLHKDDTFSESIVGYAISVFMFIVANMPMVYDFFQYVAIICGVGVGATQLLINIRKLRSKGTLE